jgi:NifU-like protein involved in Fe-S cluster formation
MSGPLYTTEILRLAASTASFARLKFPHGTASKRSPVCGSSVTIDIKLDDKACVTEVGGEIRACAFGQASSALLGQSVKGKTAPELAEARDALRRWLSGASASPGDWPGLMIFESALSRTARHAAILLAFEAAAEAAEMASAP